MIRILIKIIDWSIDWLWELINQSIDQWSTKQVIEMIHLLNVIEINHQLANKTKQI